MKKFTNITIIAVTILMLTVPAGAQMYRKGMAKRMKPGIIMKRAEISRLRDKLSNLTAEQRETLRNERRTFLDETSDLRSNIRKKREEFMDLLKSDNPVKSEVMAVRQELMDLKTTLFEKKFDLRQKQRTIINSATPSS